MLLRYFIARRKAVKLIVLSHLVFISCCCVIAAQSLSAQPNRPRRAASGKEIDNELKSLLNDYYAGKPVRARIVIPANEHGIEVVDGQLKIQPLLTMTAAVQPGELVLIKELRFKSRAIEVYFNGEHLSEAMATAAATPLLAPVGNFGAEADATPSPARVRETTKIRALPDPHIVLRFSRDIGTQDLNLQSINRLLASAVDVSSLAPNTALSATAPPPPPPDPVAVAQAEATAHGIPVPQITGELVGSNANVGEITIECNVANARLYLDGAFSGNATRTIQLTTGTHSMLVLATGYEQSEQKFFLPAGKATLIKITLQPAKNKF